MFYFTKTALLDDAQGSGSSVACILDLCGTCRWVVILTPRPLYLNGLASIEPQRGCEKCVEKFYALPAVRGAVVARLVC